MSLLRLRQEQGRSGPGSETEVQWLDESRWLGPADPSEFALRARMIVGPPNTPGEESFAIRV